MKSETEVVQDVFRVYLEFDTLTPNPPDRDHPNLDTNLQREPAAPEAAHLYRIKQFRTATRLAVDMHTADLWDCILPEACIQLSTLRLPHQALSWNQVNYYELVQSNMTCHLRPLLHALFDVSPSRTMLLLLLPFWQHIQSTYGGAELYLFRMALVLQLPNPQADLAEYIPLVHAALLHVVQKELTQEESEAAQFYKVVGGLVTPSVALSLVRNYTPSIPDEF